MTAEKDTKEKRRRRKKRAAAKKREKSEGALVFETLTDGQKEVAINLVRHPEWAEWVCYSEAYPEASKTTAQRNMTRLKKQANFIEYVDALQKQSSLAAQQQIDYHKILAAIEDPHSRNAAEIIADLTIKAYESLDPEHEVDDTVIVGTGKGYTEPVDIKRKLSPIERIQTAKLVRDNLNLNKNSDMAVIPVKVIRNDVRPPKPAQKDVKQDAAD